MQPLPLRLLSSLREAAAQNTWRYSYDEAYTLFDTALFLLNMNARNTATISRPGCWAMAGMLMLGVGALPHDRTLSQLSHSLDDSMNQ